MYVYVYVRGHITRVIARCGKCTTEDGKEEKRDRSVCIYCTYNMCTRAHALYILLCTYCVLRRRRYDDDDNDYNNDYNNNDDE